MSVDGEKQMMYVILINDAFVMSPKERYIMFQAWIGIFKTMCKADRYVELGI